MAVSVIEKEIEIVNTIEIERKAIRVVTRATNTVSMTNTIDATALVPAVVIAMTQDRKSTRNTREGTETRGQGLVLDLLNTKAIALQCIEATPLNLNLINKFDLLTR